MPGTSRGPRALVGAHVSVSGGLSRGTLARVDEIGAEVIQVFLANPRGWAEPDVDPAADEAFGLSCAPRGLPVFVHAPYLINFGSPSPETVARSHRALAFSLRRAAAVGAVGVVVHAGSAVSGHGWDEAMGQVREHVRQLLDEQDASPDRAGPEPSSRAPGRSSRGRQPRLLIEPTAGGGGALASGIDSIGAYLAAIDDPRVGVCVDTCHLHAAGHDLSTPAGMRAAFRALRRAIGAGRIGLVHVNDSRDPVGSRRDRHASPGQGTIGLPSFGALFETPALLGVPMILETPESGYAADIAALKQLRG